MNATTYGLDVAKRVFQIYWVDADTGEIVNRRFGHDDLIQYVRRDQAESRSATRSPTPNTT